MAVALSPTAAAPLLQARMLANRGQPTLPTAYRAWPPLHILLTQHTLMQALPPLRSLNSAPWMSAPK